MRMSTLLLHELAGEVCQCGSHKFQKTSFCWECYHRLPAAMQRALYNRRGDGYEEAYLAALKVLRPEASKCAAG